MQNLTEPKKNCSQCNRLFKFRKNNKINYPKWFNEPVPNFGNLTSEIMIVGLAPGLKGANKTGRPFTGDFAGDLLLNNLAIVITYFVKFDTFLFSDKYKFL